MGRKYDQLAAALASAAEFYEGCARDYETDSQSANLTTEGRAVYRGRALAYANAARYMRTMLKTSSPVRAAGEQMRAALGLSSIEQEHPARHDPQYCIPVAWAGTLLEGVDLNDERAVRQALALAPTVKVLSDDEVDPEWPCGCPRD